MRQNLFAKLFKKAVGDNTPPRKPLIPLEGATPDKPTGFGYKCNWLAVSTTDIEKLAIAFDLTETTPCNWEYGIHYAYEGRYFVTPPVNGWTFIVSRSLPFAEDMESVQLIKVMLIDLSKTFGHAQYFGTMRVVGYDSWIKAEDGHIVRAYSISDGSNFIVEGTPTDAEKKYNLANTLSEESQNDPGYFDRTNIDWPDESMTMEIAGAWSINPQDLNDINTPSARLGLLGPVD